MPSSSARGRLISPEHLPEPLRPAPRPWSPTGVRRSTSDLDARFIHETSAPTCVEPGRRWQGARDPQDHVVAEDPASWDRDPRRMTSSWCRSAIRIVQRRCISQSLTTDTSRFRSTTRHFLLKSARDPSPPTWHHSAGWQVRRVAVVPRTRPSEQRVASPAKGWRRHHSGGEHRFRINAGLRHEERSEWRVYGDGPSARERRDDEGPWWPSMDGVLGHVIAGATTVSPPVRCRPHPAGVAHNARALKADWAALDSVVISHGHADHTGGLLEALRSCGRRIPVLLHPEALLPKLKTAPVLREMESAAAAHLKAAPCGSPANRSPSRPSCGPVARFLARTRRTTRGIPDPAGWAPGAGRPL